MNRKTLLWLIIAFVAGGFLAARQSILEQQSGPAPTAPKKVSEYSVKVFLIAPQDGADNKSTSKKVGCGDNTVAIAQKASGSSEVEAALNALLALKDENYGESGLYNALYQSDLKLSAYDQKQDTALVKLTGTLTLGGACDNPRVRAQLEQTIKNATTVNNVKITINGASLDYLLSGK